MLESSCRCLLSHACTHREDVEDAKGFQAVYEARLFLTQGREGVREAVDKRLGVAV